MYNLTHAVLFCAFILMLSSCAVPSNPSGGPKDTQPPIIVEESTPSGTTNFTGNELTIVFNEYIKLSKNVIVSSPPIPNKSIKVSAIRDKLRVKFSEELLDSTTYILNFGSNIVDVNEGNALKDFKIVFSTGDKIDSLEIQGSITIKSPELKFDNNTYVLLHVNLGDSIISEEKPFYIARVNESGIFKMDYLKKGVYNVFVLKDQNSNYLFDLPNEAIGFMEDAISIDSNLYNVNMDLFVPKQKDKIAEYTNIDQGFFKLKFNNPLSEEQYISLGSNVTDSILWTISKDKKSLDCWLLPFADSTEERINIFVNVDSVIVDTIELYNLVPEEKRLFSITEQNNIWVEGDSISIELNQPYWDDSAIEVIVRDTSGLKIDLTHTRRLSPLHLEFYSEELMTKMSYDLAIIYESDTAKSKFNILSKEDVGRLILNFEFLNDTSDYYILELYSSNKDLVRFLKFTKSEKEITFEQLVPGNYTTKIISDKNNNGKWDSGDFWSRSKPEPYYEHDKPMSVKANWEALETIKVDFK